MATFITRLDYARGGVRLAVKDLIDLAGSPTTAGSQALAAAAVPAVADAPCLAGARAARVPIVGKVNLHELAFGASGVNDYFGTPVNPLDPGRVPELESALKITEEVLRHLIVRKPEKAAVATTVAPPPAEVVLEPIAAESEPVGEPAASANGKES